MSAVLTREQRGRSIGLAGDKICQKANEAGCCGRPATSPHNILHLRLCHLGRAATTFCKPESPPPPTTRRRRITSTRRPTAARYHHARAHTAPAPARFTQFAFIAIACCRVVPLLVWAQTGRRSGCIRPCHEAATRNGQQRTTTAARAGLSARRRAPLPFPQAAH